MALRDPDAKPPNAISRLIGSFQRWHRHLELVFSKFGDDGPRELSELQLRLSDVEMKAVVCLGPVSDRVWRQERTHERARVRLCRMRCGRVWSSACPTTL